MTKLKQEFVKQEYENKGYKLITEYEDAKVKLFVEDKDGYICSSKWSDFKNGAKPSRIHSNNPYTIQNIKHFIELHTKGYKLLSKEYINCNSKLLFKCPEGHEFEMIWSNFQKGQRCPVCSGNKVLKGYNDIATTDPWMIELGMSREDAEKYSRCSNNKIKVICPHCKKTKSIRISSIYMYKSISCSCGDGISYPEKFVMSMLNQLNIQYIKEYKPSWSNNKRYDFYFEYNNKKYIIECHGEQHYRYTGFNRSLQEEQQNDLYKKELAKQNDIDEYIILDCRKSNLEQIKNSILNSKLNNIFDLSHINWLQCDTNSLINKVKEICDYWRLHNEINNERLTTVYIGEIFDTDKSTINKYLKKGTKLGWCNYNPKEEIKKNGFKNGKSNSKPVEIFKDGKSLGVFPSCNELSRQSEELFGVKLFQSNICEVCRGKTTQYKEFVFKYTS